MSDVTVRLSRAEAERLKDFFAFMWAPTPLTERMATMLDAALAADPAPEPDAPADVPERATPCDDVQEPLGALIAECEAHPDWRWEVMQDHPGVYRAAIDGPAFAAVSSRETPVDALRGAIEAMQRAAGEPQGSED